MDNPIESPGHQIDKQHVAAITVFAVNNIPGVDEFTLRKFLELMNTTGSFGSTTNEQLLETMRLMLKYIPGASADSLRILLELLGGCLPLNLQSNIDFLTAPPHQLKLIKSDKKSARSIAVDNRR